MFTPRKPGLLAALRLMEFELAVLGWGRVKHESIWSLMLRRIQICDPDFPINEAFPSRH